jgi:beta-glucosidase
LTTRARTLADLTLEEKTLIALGAIGEVDGLPTFVYSDGPNGVRDATNATAFPSALVLAASFDLAIAAEYGAALGDEVRAAGRNVLLGPAADILRVPWNGRSGESFGEDPLLSGEMAGTVGAAVQSRGVLAVLKHFVANNFERLRTGTGSDDRRTPAVDVQVGERALREIYLQPFRRALQGHAIAALMTSYNRLRGRYISENREMLDLPRREWGFTGTTLPDFIFAVREPVVALNAGLDLPGLDGPSGRERSDVVELPVDQLDAIASHVLASIDAVSLTDPVADPTALGADATLQLAEHIAQEGAVLLANDGVLPLPPGARVALIAPEPLSHVALIGGSASVTWPTDRAPHLAAELTRSGLLVSAVDAGDADVPLETIDATAVVGGRVSLIIRDSLTGTEVPLDVGKVELFERPPGIGAEWSAAGEFDFLPPGPGLYRFSLDFAGEATLRAGSTAVEGFREASPMLVGPAYPLQTIVESAGEPIHISFDFDTAAALDVPPIGLRPGFRLGWREVSRSLSQAVEAARSCDVAVVVVGRAAGEAMDVDSLRLPLVQEKLIAAVVAANPRTIVVTAGSGPVVMPWRDEVAAILHVGQAGERIAPAVARILTGMSEPGGRLPFTVPQDEGDVPLTRSGYPGESSTATYDEGMFVGYRGYAERGVEPAFPFGHGLGYTTFEISEGRVVVEHAAIRVIAVAHNGGARVGKVVPQVYVTAKHGGPRALRGFAALHIDESTSQEFEIVVPVEDLLEFDESAGKWNLPSQFRVDLGLSSTHTIWSTQVELTAG